jgi:hypothetical protein
MGSFPYVIQVFVVCLLSVRCEYFFSFPALETPSRILKWSPLGFLSHIKRRTIGDRFPLSLWEVWFCSTLGVPIPALIGPSQGCSCNVFDYDVCADHLQTCRVKSAASQG